MYVYHTTRRYGKAKLMYLTSHHIDVCVCAHLIYFNCSCYLSNTVLLLCTETYDDDAD